MIPIVKLRFVTISEGFLICDNEQAEQCDK